LKNAVGEENDEDVSQFDVLAASETEEFTLAEIRIKAADLAQHVIISDLVISSFVYLFLEFRYEVYNKHASFLEEIVSIREIWFLSLLVVSFRPGFSKGSLHVVIAFFVHFLHHIHDGSVGIVRLRLFFFGLSRELIRLKLTFSSLKASCDHDLLSFFVKVTVSMLVFSTNLLSVGLISPNNFLIAKMRFCFL
jgi:hypothetical protein